MNFRRTLRKRRKLIIFAILLIAVITFVIAFIASLTPSFNNALTYLTNVRKNITIEGTLVYNKISNEGCGIIQTGQTLSFMCDVRLDVYYQGTGDYIRDYYALEEGLKAAGYNVYGYQGHNTYSGGMFLQDEEFYRERKNVTLGNINDYMPDEGLIKFDEDQNDLFTIWLIPLFGGTGVNSTVTTQGITLYNLSAPKAALKDNNYVYGYTLRKYYFTFTVDPLYTLF